MVEELGRYVLEEVGGDILLGGDVLVQVGGDVIMRGDVQCTHGRGHAHGGGRGLPREDKPDQRG